MQHTRSGRACPGSLPAIADLKAVSQNLMPSSLTVSDGIYGALFEDGVGERIVRTSRSAIATPKTTQPLLTVGMARRIWALSAPLSK